MPIKLRGKERPTGSLPVGLGPHEIFRLFTGLDVPDIITFVIGEKWLERSNIYPRQATLLKIIFLRDDLFTEYDHHVIDQWETSFRQSGDNGIVPGVRDRIRILRTEGRRWFRETLLVLGRRAGKGHISGLSMAYVLWNYMAKGDPQGYYGVDRDKKLQAMVFAGKRDQAKATVWQDAVNYITGSQCFAPYVRAPLQAEKLSIYAPHDFVRMRKRMAQGMNPDDINMATFELVPKESTLMAGRGPTSFMQAYDEMAHVVAAGANRSAEEVYCLDPETRVLGSDLIWRPIKDLRPGMKVVSLDEYPKVAGEQRKLREATVKGVRYSRSAPLKLTFEDGSSVICSDNHRWFRVSADGNDGKWVFAGPQPQRTGSAGRVPVPLKVGDRIRHIVDPWEVDDTRDGGYLAGLYDGEGWVSSPKASAFKIGFVQNPGTVFDATVRLLRERNFDPVEIPNHSGSKCRTVEVRGLADCLRLLGQLRPLRLLEKSVDLWKGKAPRGKVKAKKIISIERLPEQDLVDIETTEATFLAEGLVSHNTAATPSLDQFGKDGFIIEPSSPWQMLGQFYTNYCNSILMDEHNEPVYPEMLMIQLASWEIYEDWEIAHTLPVFPEGYTGDLGEYEDQPRLYFKPLRGAIQAYDDQMARLEQSNPETFRVERRSKFAVALDAYLNEEKVKQIFAPWTERNPHFGGPQLGMQVRGRLDIDYMAHGDPSKSNANFGLALAHAEPGPDGRLHVVFDKIHHFWPGDFTDHIVDYDEVEEWIWDNMMAPFMPTMMTFDQFNSAQVIGRLQKRSRNSGLPKTTMVSEETATRQHNWKRAEIFKTAVNMGWVHAPYYEQGELELRFLQEKNGVVDHPDSGPVQTKDVADAMMECVMKLIGDQIISMRSELGAMRPTGALLGGVQPFPGMSAPDLSAQDRNVMEQLGGFGRARGGRPETMGSGGHRRGRRY